MQTATQKRNRRIIDRLRYVSASLTSQLIEDLDISSIEKNIEKTKDNLNLRQEENKKAREKIVKELRLLKDLLESNVEEDVKASISSWIPALENSLEQLKKQNVKKERELLQAEYDVLRLLKHLPKVVDNKETDNVVSNVLKTKIEAINSLQYAHLLLAKVEKVIAKLVKHQKALSDFEDLDDDAFDELTNKYDELDDNLEKLGEFRDRIQKRIVKLTNEINIKKLFTEIKDKKNTERSQLAEKYSEAAKLIVTQFHDLLVQQIIPSIPNDPKFESALFKVAAKIEKLSNNMRNIATKYKRDVLSRISILLAPATYNVLAEGFIEGLKKNDGIDLEAKVADVSEDTVTEEQKKVFEKRRQQKLNKEPIQKAQGIINTFVPRMADIMATIPNDKGVVQSLLKQSATISRIALGLVNHTNKFKKMYPDASLAILAYINMVKSVEIALKMAIGKR